MRIQNQYLQDTICANFQTKQTTLTFSAQICPKMDFGGRNFKNLSLYSQSTPPRYYVCKFSGKQIDEFFYLNSGGSIVFNISFMTFLRKLLNFTVPFKRWVSTSSRLESLPGGGLLFTTKFPKNSGTHFINLEMMKG